MLGLERPIVPLVATRCRAADALPQRRMEKSENGVDIARAYNYVVHMNKLLTGVGT
jgi:hypothetical protein